MAIDQIGTAGVADGAVVPADLSTGAPTWDASGNTSVVGRLTAPLQPMFFAWGGGTQSWSGAANTQILQLNQSNTFGSHPNVFSTSTYTFTAPVAGTYMFWGKLAQQTSAGGPACFLYVNGAQAPGPEFLIAYGVAYMSASGVAALQLAANDQVTMRVINYNSATVTIDTTRCALMGYLIG